MKCYLEKRTCERCNYAALVTCAHFNSDYFYHAKTTNHSKDGMYFELDSPLKPGASIYIRVDHNLPKASGTGICGCGGFRMIALAEVKWCEEIQDTDDFCYGVGLKYYEPAI
jgi:hypothetical protein